MPKYRALNDIWISHECRKVKAGDEFEATFPAGPGGKPMQLGESLELIEEKKPGKAAKAADEPT